MKKKSIFILLLAATVCFSCIDNQNDTPVQETEIVTLNVDVILPPAILEQWQNTIDWALENIAKAQLKELRQVKLNLRYHNEDTEDMDLLGYELTHPEEGADTCHAIVGPYHSDSAPDILKYAKQKRLPVVMPTCTSAELQRTNARNTYAWFLTESDLTQCEIMLAAARTMNATDVALIYSDNTYGRSFSDWLSYFAAEQGIHIATDGIEPYHKGDDLYDYFTRVSQGCQGENLWLCVALSDTHDYLEVGRQLTHFRFNPPEGIIAPLFTLICADTSLDEGVLENLNDSIAFDYGVCPFASMNYGFPQAYQSRYGRQPYNGEAQIYDALTIIALGAAHRLASPDQCLVNGSQVVYYEKPYEPGLTDYMRAVISSSTGTPTQWEVNGLATAFQTLGTGKSIDMNGATGNLFFDQDSHTKILNTNYMLWMADTEEDNTEDVVPFLFLSTSGSSGASTTLLWQLEKRWKQTFDETTVIVNNLPKVSDHWAVVVSPSTTWSNYRHQADAFAMYQTLRNHGYDDDHIILIVEDNLAFDSRNIYPGEIFVERSDDPNVTDALVNDDVRKNALVDYHFSDLQPADLADIMMGRSSDRLPHVINPTAQSNVFFFWSGHGGSREGPLWGNEDARESFGTQRIHDIVTQMSENKQFRRMMLAIETCYSGKWGEALEGIPNLLVLTAANPDETSKADVHDRNLGVYLSNAFARTFRREVNGNNAISIYDLYKQLARTTTGSHVTIYNNSFYGPVYSETMDEFLPE